MTGQPSTELSKSELILLQDGSFFEHGTGALYEHEMKDEKDHIRLIEALNLHTSPVVLSMPPLYGEQLIRWQRVTMPALAEKKQVRTEVFWLNRSAGRRQLSLFEEGSA